LGEIYYSQPESRDKHALLFDLGFSRDYQKVWTFQKQILEKRIEGKIPDALILVEHDHVLTLGRGGHAENILIEGLPKFEIERGGDVTYHGPGQLVAYPVVSLTERNLGVRQYVEKLELVISECLLKFGLNSEGKLGLLTGVWIDGKRKIASIGVATSHWVTYHGVALNVNTDLSYFQKIRPCGFEAGIMTSMAKELGSPLDIAAVRREITESFSNQFEMNLAPSESLS